MLEKIVTPIGTTLPIDWRMRPLGEMCSKIGSGATPKGGSDVYVTSGVSFIRSQNVFDHHFSSAGLAFIDDYWAERLRSAEVLPKDVLLNITGDGDTIARCCVSSQEHLPARVNQHVVIIRIKDDRALDHRYLQRYMSHPRMRQFMLSHNSGGSRRALTKAQIEKFPIVLPPIEVQRQIADLLGALDDKIAANDRIVSTADALRSSLLQDAQNQRPDDFVAQPLSQIAEFINGRAFTKDATGSGRMVVRIAEINSGPGPSTVYNDIAVNKKHLVRPGDVLFSWSGSLAVTRWFRPEAIINQHIFKVIPHGDTPKWLAFEAVKSKLADYRAIAADKATTMGHIQRRHLDEEIVMPIPEVINRLDRQAGSLWQRALVAEQESLTLAALRDSLLPELMSGRLRVRDAEKVVEEAV